MTSGRGPLTWGGVVLDAVDLSTSRSRAFITQMPARGNGGSLSDRGKELRECRVQIRWIKRDAHDDPDARLRALLALDDGKTRLLAHPIDGVFPAKMSIEDENLASGRASTNLRFVEDRGDPRHGGTRAGATVTSATERVVGSARAAEEALRAHDLSTVVPAETAALARTWNAASAPAPAEIEAGHQRQSAAIQTSLDHAGASSDAARLDIYFALLDLQAALADAADVMRARESLGHGLVALELHEPVTLLALCADVYGAALARQRVDQILRLNPDVRNANVVTAPITLMVPSA